MKPSKFKLSQKLRISLQIDVISPLKWKKIKLRSTKISVLNNTIFRCKNSSFREKIFYNKDEVTYDQINRLVSHVRLFYLCSKIMLGSWRKAIIKFTRLRLLHLTNVSRSHCTWQFLIVTYSTFDKKNIQFHCSQRQTQNVL